MKQDFEKKKQELPHGDLFEIFSQSLSTEEREALMFLYTCMPIGDITDYSGAFYLSNVKYTLQARQEMPWGKQIPEQLFRHFVLPIRINNENLDESRKVFYEELFRSKVRVAPDIKFESAELISRLQMPPMSRKVVKFFDLRNNI